MMIVIILQKHLSEILKFHLLRNSTHGWILNFWKFLTEV